MDSLHAIDLHTHSVASPDGSLTLAHYRRMLDEGRLDFIAITDHNTIAFAQAAHAELGKRIIVGEEITTTQGEIIGLFLTAPVPAGLPLAEAVERIKAQNGLVYVPHPFEKVRSGIAAPVLEKVASEVDIVEIYNGRAVFENRGRLAKEWAMRYHLPGAASSDSHGWYGWGATYSLIDQPPSRATLTQLLRTARYQAGFPGLRGMLYPKFNRLRKVH